MGSAYTTIAADVVARFQRLRGRRVTFVTGTDEHGEKIALSATAKGQAPKEHCDGVVAAFQELWRLVRATPSKACCGVAERPWCLSPLLQCLQACPGPLAPGVAGGLRY